MSFTVHVRFTGLCMFVPDRKQNLLQVLMPAAHHHHDGGQTGTHDDGAHHGVEPHVVMVAYDAGYETAEGKSAGRPDMPRYAPDACAGAEIESPMMTEVAPGDEFQVMGGSIFTCMVAGGCPDAEGCGDDD